ncbi:MAG: methyltransferase domain-containing protein [Deltaproteobacteria bacterium]|nr:methyltransferase domain-containing protein [Deltaproteobacteria bacterium]
MWDERFSHPDYVYGTEPNDFLVEAAPLLPPGPLLELGAGEGRNGVWLATRGHAVTLVDGSHVGLAKARALAEARGVRVTTEVADLADFPIGEAAWPGIVMIFVHLPPELRRTVLRRVARGLAPGGALVLEAYTPAQIALATGGPRDPTWCMTLADLTAELAGLELVIGRELERDVHEGFLHGGRSAVVQVVARRPAG